MNLQECTQKNTRPGVFLCPAEAQKREGGFYSLLLPAVSGLFLKRATLRSFLVLRSLDVGGSEVWSDIV